MAKTISLTLSSKLNSVLEAKQAIKVAVNAIALNDSEKVSDKFDEYAGKILAIGTSYNEVIAEKVLALGTATAQLSATAQAHDAYYANGSADRVGDNYANLAGAVETLVNTLKAADNKDAEIKVVLSNIAGAVNVAVNNIEEIPEALQGTDEGKFENTEEGLKAYKNSLLLEVVDDDTVDPVAVYETYTDKIAALVSQVSASEMKILELIVTTLNTAKYGVTEGNKLEATVPAGFGKFAAALDDVLAKGYANALGELSETFASKKTVDDSAVVVDDPINNVADAFDAWVVAKNASDQALADVKADIKTKVNQTSDEAVLVDADEVTTYGTKIKFYIESLKTTISETEASLETANTALNQVKSTVNAQNIEGISLGDSATPVNIADGVNDVLEHYSDLLDVILNGESE